MCKKFDLSLKTLSKSGLNKPISPFFKEAHIVKDGQTDRHTNCSHYIISVEFVTSLVAWHSGGLNKEYMILGQNVAVSALSPGPLGQFLDK